jgi:hypothetical protein
MRSARRYSNALKTKRGLVLDENMFVEKMLPGVTQRTLSADEMAECQRPFLEAGDDRWPTLQWPREVPLSDGPESSVPTVSLFGKSEAAPDSEMATLRSQFRRDRLPPRRGDRYYLQTAWPRHRDWPCRGPARRMCQMFPTSDRAHRIDMNSTRATTDLTPMLHYAAEDRSPLAASVAAKAHVTQFPCR